MKIFERMFKQTELRQITKELESVKEQRATIQKAAAEMALELKRDGLSAEEYEELKVKAEPLGEEALKLDAQIEELEAKSTEIEEELKESEPETEETTERSNTMEMITREATRKMVETGEYYERGDVQEFYRKTLLNVTRGVDGGSYTIPQVIVNRIYDIMGDYTTLYPLVDTVKIKGTARILIDADTSEATWTEMGSAITAGDVGTINAVDFLGYKLGKITYVDNYLLQDSIINIDEYVTTKLARALAKALDKAIMVGEGATNYQPTGILTALADESGTPHIVEVDNDESVLVNTVKQIASIDDGTDTVGNITAVMSRATYYNIFFNYSVQVNSSGNVVGKLPNLTTPDLIGIPVVFSNYVPDDTVVFGDFNKYVLVDREDIVIERSDHYKFADDQASFRGKGRFDGKVLSTGAFLRVNLVDPA